MTPTASAASPEPALAARAFDGPAQAFLDDPDLLQRLNLIRHLMQSTRLAVLVSGPEGAGKSACLDELQRQAQARWLFCRIAGATTRDPERVMARLARCCDLPPDCGRAALRQLLGEHATLMHRNAQLPVIAVDDAHAMEIEALRELVALTAGDNGWRLLLCAEPGHDGLWTEAGLTSAAQLHRLEWPPLSEAQTGAYVLQRLRAAGWDGGQPLSAEQVRKLHRDSAGLPGAIDRLAPAMLGRRPPSPAPSPAAAPGPASAAAPASAPPTSSRRPSARAVRIGAAAAAVGVIALVLWQQDRINAVFQPPAPPAQEPSARTQPKALPKPAPQQTPPSSATSQVPPPVTPEPAPSAPSVTGPETQAPAAAETPALPAAEAPAPEMPVPVAPPADPTAEPEPAIAASDRNPERDAVMPDTGTPTPEAEPAPGPAPGPASEGQPATAPAAPEPEPEPEAPTVVEVPAPLAETSETPGDAVGAAPAPAPAPDREAQAAPTATAATETREAVETPPPSDTAGPDPAPAGAVPQSTTPATAGPGERWILARDPDHYTLQLLGSRELQPVRALIERYDLDSDTAWYKIQYQGADWYVLVHGDFADARAASRAVAQLPAGLRRAGPWPRPLGAVQAEVRRGRK